MTPFERLMRVVDSDDITEKDRVTLKLLLIKEHYLMQALKTHQMTDQHVIASISLTYATIDLHHKPCNETLRLQDMQCKRSLLKCIRQARKKGFKGATYFHNYVKERRPLGSFPDNIHKFIEYIGEKAVPARIVSPKEPVESGGAYYKGDTADKVLAKRVAARKKK